MKTVTIYTTPTCGFCKQVKAFLTQENIAYEEHDVTTDDAALQEMQDLSGGSMSVPFIVFNKGLDNQETQIGYDPEKVKAALGL